MTTVFVIVAVCILVAGLFAVIVERTNERDEARAELARRDREADVPADVVRLPLLRSVPMRRDIPAQRGGEHDALPAADESWLDDSPLFRDGEGRWS